MGPSVALGPQRAGSKKMKEVSRRPLWVEPQNVEAEM